MIIALYNHEYGNQAKLFANIEAVNKWKDTIASDYWDDYFPNDTRPEKAGNAYFELMLESLNFNESFEIIENVELEGDKVS
jgi:hypothetical protein